MCVIIGLDETLDPGETDGSDDCECTGTAIVVTCIVTFVVSVTIASIITFIATYLCVKRKFENVKYQSPDTQQKVLYEEVSSRSHTITKNDLEMQSNPAYGTSSKVIMDVNPAYESCKL